MFFVVCGWPPLCVCVCADWVLWCGGAQAQLQRSIRLEPQFFNEAVVETLRERLFREVEGQCFGDEGYVLAITQITNASLGFVNDEDGSATYHMHYNALVFKPFRNEVLDAVVSNVTENGITCSIGPFSVIVAFEVCTSFPSLLFHSFPLHICVPPQNMGEGYKFDPEKVRFIPPNGGELAKNSRVRIKLLNVSAQVGDIVCCFLLPFPFFLPSLAAHCCCCCCCCPQKSVGTMECPGCGVLA